MKTIDCDKQISIGFEHRVFLSEDGEEVIKVPTALGGIWHKMHPALAERDSTFLAMSHIPYVPTTVDEGPLVLKVRGKKAREVAYVMRQPYIRNARTLDISMLKRDERLRAAFAGMISRGKEMFHEMRLGVDFVGGQASIDLLKATLLIAWKIRANVYNVLVPTEDQADSSGNIFAPKNEPILCDTRLYDCTGTKVDVMSRVRESIQKFQHEILEVFLQALEPDSIPNNRRIEAVLHRLAALGVHRGILMNGARIEMAAA